MLKRRLVSKRVIEVVEYDSAWKLKFEIEKSLLKGILGNAAIKIEHIGSTSIEGLAAKPIIDIQIEVTNLSELESKNSQFESCGYIVKGENGIEGRRYFQKGGHQRSHQVHCFVSGDENLIRHRAFRDYLIAFPNIASKYAQIKLRAVSQCNNNIIQYMNLKNDFILHHQALALEWFGS